MTPRLLVIAGAFAALVGVGAGAFGAHALEGRVAANLEEVFRTAVRYQMYHALGLVGLGALAGRWPDPLWSVAGWLFLAGILLFSGSLYALALTGVRWVGAVTPVGGGCFLAGWACACVAGLRAVSA